jgi:hypothetical protein
MTMNAFTNKQPPAWLKELQRDHKNKVGGGAVRAKNAKGMAVPSLSNGKGVKNMALDKMAANARELGLDYSEGWDD